jgi:peroxiredoxin
VQLAQWQARFEALGVNVAAMSYDDVATLRDFHDSEFLDYPLLQDLDSRHFRDFGVLNPEYEPGDTAYGVPLPGVLFISPEGIVRRKFAVPGYRERPPLAQIHAALVADADGSDG